MRPILTILALTLGLACGAPLAAQQPVAEQLARLPDSGERKLTIFRKGVPIGTHHIRFRRDGMGVEMEVEARAEVALLGITVFRLSHTGRERWQAGRLVRLATTTDDDGESYEVTARRSPLGALSVTSNGRRSEVAGDSIPSSLWHLDLLLQRPRDEILHTIHGGLLPMTVTALGEKELQLAGRRLTVRGFAVDARPDFYRELWYDAEGLLVAAELSGADGSTVTLRLE